MRYTWLMLMALLAATPVFSAEEEPAPAAEESSGEEEGEEAKEEKEPKEEGGLEGAVETYTRLPETVVIVTRREEEVFNLPRAVTPVSEEQVRMQMPRHAVDVLTRRDAGIVMDIRTATTGDPIMRGFAGFNILGLIDGNSLSTLWGEGGFGADDMYGKIDADTIERIEVVRGPGSVLYGSNALGGVINFITRSSPIDYTDGALLAGGRTATTYMTNNRGWRLRNELFGATDTVKGLFGVSYAHYADARSAEKELDPTRGEEVNFDARTDWLLAPGHELTVSVLHIFRHPTYRYYRPTQDNKSERWGIAATWRAEELADFMEDFEWRAYYQDKRDQRRFLDTGRNGYARTITWSTDVQATTELPERNVATYGLHASVDLGEAPDDEQFKFTKPVKRSDAPDSMWANYAVFLQDEFEMIPDSIFLTGAARYDFFVFNAEETDSYRPEGGDRQADFFRDTKGALTGGLGVAWAPHEEWRVLGSWSRGFRQFAPNFGFRLLGNGVLVPNQLLDPVTSDNYEFGLRTRQRTFDAEGFVYYSDIKDWQALRPDTYEGSDWYDFNENGKRDVNEDVISQQSVQGAWVWGIELKGALRLSELFEELPEGFSAWGSFAFNRGETDDNEYFRHTQPARGLIGLRWDDPDPDRGFYVELIAEMVNRYHRIPRDRVKNDLAYREEPQDGDSPLLRSYGGVPGYTVYYLYAGMNLSENSRLTLGIENLTDKKFRRAHSRMDALGFNLILGVELSF